MSLKSICNKLSASHANHVVHAKGGHLTNTALDMAFGVLSAELLVANLIVAHPCGTWRTSLKAIYGADRYAQQYEGADAPCRFDFEQDVMESYRVLRVDGHKMHETEWRPKRVSLHADVLFSEDMPEDTILVVSQPRKTKQGKPSLAGISTRRAAKVIVSE